MSHQVCENKLEREFDLVLVGRPMSQLAGLAHGTHITVWRRSVKAQLVANKVSRTTQPLALRCYSHRCHRLALAASLHCELGPDDTVGEVQREIINIGLQLLQREYVGVGTRS